MTGIFRNELIAEPCRETVRAEMAQIVVEVAEPRAKHDCENAGLAGALAETFDAVPAGGVRVGGDVEAAAAGRDDQTGEACVTATRRTTSLPRASTDASITMRRKTSRLGTRPPGPAAIGAR